MISISIITRYTRCFAFQFKFLKLYILLKTSLISHHKTSFSEFQAKNYSICILIVSYMKINIILASLFTDKHPTLFIIIDSLSVLFSLHKANIVKTKLILPTLCSIEQQQQQQKYKIPLYIFFYLYFLITIVLGINI